MLTFSQIKLISNRFVLKISIKESSFGYFSKISLKFINLTFKEIRFLKLLEEVRDSI